MSGASVIVIPSYNGVRRVWQLLRSIASNDAKIIATFDRCNQPGPGLAPIMIVEDPSDDETAKAYGQLAAEWHVDYHRLSQWSNMHGAAQNAFELAIERYKPKWIIYLGDDVLVTPCALTNMIYFVEKNELNTVALVQFPYWNAHDLLQESQEYPGPALLKTKDDMYSLDLEWLRRVPRNAHWDGQGYARPYINVNGAGFCARAETFVEVGGFAKGTWCLDESLSLRVWRKSEKSIVCLPGPPLVHYFGAASLLSNPPPHALHTEHAWIEAMGCTKAECSTISYKIMAEREAAVCAEMARAKYFDGPY